MDDKLFNGLTLSNEEIEKILKDFDKEIKDAVRKINGMPNQDYEQNIRIQIFKRLSKNREN